MLPLMLLVVVLEVAACHIIKRGGDFPGSPMVKTSPSDAGGVGSTTGWETNPCRSTKKNQNIR